MSTLHESRFEEVTFYEWSCPSCDTTNRDEELGTYVTCIECEEPFIIDYRK